MCRAFAPFFEGARGDRRVTGWQDARVRGVRILERIEAPEGYLQS